MRLLNHGPMNAGAEPTASRGAVRRANKALSGFTSLISGAHHEKFNFYGGLFLVTAATLMLQLIQTRILSVVAWYHLAFFVISMAMFGLTAGAGLLFFLR